MLRELARDAVHSVTIRLAYALAASARVDGLWVGVFSGAFDQRAALDRVRNALHLIAELDPRRYAKVRRLLRRVFVVRLPGRLAQYVHSLRQCQLDDRFVMAPRTPISEIAAAIIHEATHARLQHWGVPYEADRKRQEHICLREELAFASRLPDPSPVTERVEQLLARDPAFWDSSDTRVLTASETALRHELRLPSWLVRAILWLGNRAA
jgi:hypothetical protein